jgi:hypothetical protein
MSPIFFCFLETLNSNAPPLSSEKNFPCLDLNILKREIVPDNEKF